MVRQVPEDLKGPKDPKVRLVTWVCRANKVHQGNQVSKEILVQDSRMECNVTQVQEVLCLKLPVHQDYQVLLVHPEKMAKMVKTEAREIQAMLLCLTPIKMHIW